MHAIILTSYCMQASILARALKRKNIWSSIHSPETFAEKGIHDTDVLIIPHHLGQKSWKKLAFALHSLSRKTPFLFFGEAHFDFLDQKELMEDLDRCIFLNEDLDLEQKSELIKEIVSKSSSRPHLNRYFSVGPLLFNRDRRSVERQGKSILLSRKEFFLLELLALNAGRIITREHIIHYVWDKRNFVSSNTIDVYVSRLRKKLNLLSSKGFIKTVPCLGYEFHLESSSYQENRYEKSERTS